MEETKTELAYRRNGDLEVVLLWSRPTGRVAVSVSDLASGETFVVPVAPHVALDAFYHPYAHAARSSPVGFRLAAARSSSD